MDVLSVTLPAFLETFSAAAAHCGIKTLSDHTVAATRKYQRECAKVTA